MTHHFQCNHREHQIARRQFLGGLSAGIGAGLAGGLGVFTQPATAKELSTQQKRVLLFFMAGGLSQLESWDPKPGTSTGGPFRAIPTSIPGLHISELLPKTAQQMHHLALIRGINTHENDHGKGRFKMEKGRNQMPGVELPALGAVCAKAIAPTDSGLPGHVRITPGGSGGRSNDAAYLGPKYASIVLGNGNPPQNSTRPDSISQKSDQLRNQLRMKLNDSFARKRRTARTDAYTYSYEQAQQLMLQRKIFDVTQESEKDQQRYGTHDFGRHCLLARRLLENGITFVQVTHTNYDTHNENFNFHLEQVGEFDGPFSTIVSDLSERGLLESTLIIVMSEFGRSPNINLYYGRDHWSAAWSICLGGGRIHPGAVIGKTNEKGTAVVDREVDAGHLFHTYLQAVGIDSTSSFDIDGRDVPIANPALGPIEELLA